jgi:hypothetical protein
MKPWNNRSDIEAALFNPAFCGELILHAVSAYNQNAKKGKFPYALSYLVLPFLLNAELFNALPATKRSKFVTWLYENRHLTPIIADKAKEMKEYTNEAILLYLSVDMLRINDQIELERGSAEMLRKRNFQRVEVEKIIKRAIFLGTWFSEAGDVVTIYSLIGITV